MRISGFGMFLAFIVLCGGCVITVENKGGRPDVDYSDRGRDAATLAEIDAASNLTFNSDQEKIYIGVALRPHLSGRAQSYLVKKAMQSLTFNDSKENVLLTLIQNPYFVAAGKQAILENLNKLTFESSKRKVLEAINRREPVPTERGLRLRLEHQPLQEPQEEGTIEMQTTMEIEVSHFEDV